MTPMHWAWLLGAIAVLALFQRSARTLSTAPFDAILRVLNVLRAWLIEAAHGLRITRSRLLDDVDLGGGRMRTTFAIGGGVFAGIALFLALCEASMVVYAMEGLFGESLSARLPPLVRNLQSVFTGGLLCAGLFAVWSFKVTGPDARTSLVVSHWYGPSARKLLRWCSGTAAVAVLASVIGLAVVRSAALDEAERVEALEARVPVGDTHSSAAGSSTYARVLHVARWVVGVSSAVAFLMAGVPAFSFAFDALQLTPPVFVTVALGVLALMRWGAGAVAGILSGVRHLITMLLDAIAWVGNPLARPVVEILRRLHRWSEERPNGRGAAHAFRGLTAALTAVGDDLQLPPASGRTWAQDASQRTSPLVWDEA